MEVGGGLETPKIKRLRIQKSTIAGWRQLEVNLEYNVNFCQYLKNRARYGKHVKTKFVCN